MTQKSAQIHIFSYCEFRGDHASRPVDVDTKSKKNLSNYKNVI